MSEKVFDLCLHTGQGLKAVDWFIDLKKAFESAGISVMAFTLNNEIGRVWQEKGMHDYIVLPEYNGSIDIPASAAFAKNLGITNFRSLYLTQQIFWDLSEEFCQNKVASYIHALRSLKEFPKARFYWTFGGDEFDHNCLRLLSRMHGGRTIYSQPTNMPGRIAIFENEDRYWKIPDTNLPEPDEKEIQLLKDYITDYIGKKTILWGDPLDRDLKWDWDYPIRFVKRIKKSWESRDLRPQTTNSYTIKQFLSRIYNRNGSKHFYSSADKFINDEEPFIYFPLHYPKDSQLTLRGKPFLNQVSIVETVSRYVPYPYTLLVKEHPLARGWYPVSDIKKMASLPNVKLIHPFTNSHDLIPNAKAIIAINSSVGYEGILYRKPVITMGKSFYRDQGVTIDVESLYELEQAFEQMDSFVLTENEVLNFLWRMKYFSYSVISYFDNSKENIKYIVAAIKHFLENRLKIIIE
jgi:hypothetical protein